MKKPLLSLCGIYVVWFCTTIACSSAATFDNRIPVPSTSLDAVTTECRSPKTEYEDIAISFDRDQPRWKVGYYADKPPIYSATEFIREDDDINNWRELLTIQNFSTSSWGLPSPEETLNALKALREKECPGATHWNVIEKSADNILYEWQAKVCQGWPEQHEIAKIIYGKYNRFMLHYVAKTYDLPPDIRSTWIKRFTESKIIARCR
jgi:hypothetical protein